MQHSVEGTDAVFALGAQPIAPWQPGNSEIAPGRFEVGSSPRKTTRETVQHPAEQGHLATYTDAPRETRGCRHAFAARTAPFRAAGDTPDGWGGIRTPGTRTGTAVFKTAALDHSATHPLFWPSAQPAWDIASDNPQARFAERTLSQSSHGHVLFRYFTPENCLRKGHIG